MFAHVLSRQFGTSSRCYRDNKTIGLLDVHQCMDLTANDDFIGSRPNTGTPRIVGYLHLDFDSVHSPLDDISDDKKWRHGITMR